MVLARALCSSVAREGSTGHHFCNLSPKATIRPPCCRDWLRRKWCCLCTQKSVRFAVGGLTRVRAQAPQGGRFWYGSEMTGPAVCSASRKSCCVRLCLLLSNFSNVSMFRPVRRKRPDCHPSGAEMGLDKRIEGGAPGVVRLGSTRKFARILACSDRGVNR